MSALSVIELRQYTLKGGRREALIELFRAEFIEPQAQAGGPVLGMFRDLDDPDRFVWLRGFAGMEQRKAALEAFYGGAAWRAHRQAANATMVDSDNVCLLRPRESGRALQSALGSDRTGVLRLSLHDLRGVMPYAFGAFFDASLGPCIDAAGATVAIQLVTEDRFNSFPKLPVREDERLFVWGAWFADQAAEAAFSTRLAAQGGWRDGAPEAVLPALMKKPEVLRLQPAGSQHALSRGRRQTGGENESPTRRFSRSLLQARHSLFQVRPTF